MTTGERIMSRVFGTTLRVIGLAILIPVTALVPVTALAQEEAQEPMDVGNTEKCINLRLIKNTTVIDDYNILFYVNQQKAYLNTMPRKCNGLAREDRFSYEARSSRLCSSDYIKVLMSGASGMRAGISCRLGEFQPMTKAEADAMKNPEAIRAEDAEILLPKPEEIGANDSSDPED
jgi:hypothetical protein